MEIYTMNRTLIALLAAVSFIALGSAQAADKPADAKAAAAAPAKAAEPAKDAKAAPAAEKAAAPAEAADRKSTRLNSSHNPASRMPSSA
jgi:hypothetical protein